MERGQFRYANGRIADESSLLQFMYKINFLTHVKNLMMGLLKENILKKINIYLLKLRTLVTIGRYTQLFDGL